MARKIKKSPKNYPNVIAFNENLEGVGGAFELAGLNLPEIGIAVKGVKNHQLAMDLDERTVFFTCDKEWLTRQPPYRHGGIVVVDVGNVPMEEKALPIRDFLYAFHIKNKTLDTLKGRRFRIKKTRLWEVTIEGKETRIW